MSGPDPTLRRVRRMIRAGADHVVCLDEVGRGALAGPVAVGAVVVSANTRQVPRGTRDSKALSPAQRAGLRHRIEEWSTCHAVGFAAAAEIDAVGINGALRLAALRALDQLSVSPDGLLLDGSHDYLSPIEIPVETVVRGDSTCAGLAAASILAKYARDELMVVLARDCPEYGWERNRGYGSPAHRAAIIRYGITAEHRRTWRLVPSE